MVVSNYTVHRDPRFWADPDMFSPERFIDPSGRFQANTEGFMAFGSGEGGFSYCVESGYR